MDQTNGARATVENPLSSSSESESEEIDQLKQIPQVLSLGASANKAICRSDLFNMLEHRVYLPSVRDGCFIAT